MFTTTLTRVSVQPIIHPLPFGPGDIVHWPAAGDVYHCYHKVGDVFMKNDAPHAIMWEAKETNTDPDKNGHHWTNAVVDFKDVRVVKSNRNGWRGGAPYLLVEREEQTESIDVDHEWALGDVIGTNLTGYQWRVDGIELNEKGEPCYRLYDVNESRDYGLWKVDRHSSAYDYKLIGGPRFVEKVTALQALTQARDLIATPATWIKGDYRDGNRFCAIGAIQHVVKDPDDLIAARAALASVIDGDNDDAHHVIVRFNDADDRSHEQVLAAFDAAIANARFVELNG